MEGGTFDVVSSNIIQLIELLLSLFTMMQENWIEGKENRQSKIHHFHKIDQFPIYLGLFCAIVICVKNGLKKVVGLVSSLAL